MLERSARSYKNRGKCVATWFSDFSWLTYCTSTNRIYCAVCRYSKRNTFITFSIKTETTFLSGGFNNWKKCLSALRDHELSSTHKEVKEKLNFIKKSTDVSKAVEEQDKKEQEIRRDCLQKQFTSIKYLLQQGSVLRGHIEEEENLNTLLALRSEDYTPLKEWQSNPANQSPVINNEQITMLGHCVVRNIVKNVSKAVWYSILADETRDISNKEQLTVCLRWVDENFEICEDFIGLVQLSDTKASTVYISLKDVLLRLGLPMNMCRGHGYDCASTVMGHLNSVAKKF